MESESFIRAEKIAASALVGNLIVAAFIVGQVMTTFNKHEEHLGQIEAREREDHDILIRIEEDVKFLRRDMEGLEN